MRYLLCANMYYLTHSDNKKLIKHQSIGKTDSSDANRQSEMLGNWNDRLLECSLSIC